MTLVATGRIADGRTTWAHSPLTHMIRLYTRYVQGLFENENPLGLHYESDEANTGIIIRAANAVNADVIDKKPAVLIHRAGFSMPSQSLGGDLHSHNLRTGETKREARLFGGMFFNVVASPDSYADDIAWWIVENIWLLKNVEGGELFQGASDFSISPPSPPQGIVQGSLTDAVLVQISFKTSILRMSSVTPVNHRILSGMTLVLKDSVTDDTLIEVETSQEGT